MPAPAPPPNSPPEDHVPLGTLGRASGLRGGIRLFPLGPDEEAALTDLDEVFVAGLGRSEVEVQRRGRYWIVFLTRVRRRERAEELVGARVYAPATALPATALLPRTGAPVERAGHALGRVSEVRRGPRDLVVVEIGDQEVLLPLNAPYVRWDGRALLLIDPPEGLLP